VISSVHRGIERCWAVYGYRIVSVCRVGRVRTFSPSLVGVQELFTEGTRHLTWTLGRKRYNEGGDSEVRNKSSTCGVAVGEQSQFAARD